MLERLLGSCIELQVEEAERGASQAEVEVLKVKWGGLEAKVQAMQDAVGEATDRLGNMENHVKVG